MRLFALATVLSAGILASVSANSKDSRVARPPPVQTVDHFAFRDVERIWARGGANFGSWASSVHYCPLGSYANGFRLSVEPHQGGGAGQDDTGLNKIELQCATPEGAKTTVITSDAERWGTPRDWQMCPDGHFMFWYQLKIESYGGDGHDDTSANGLRVGCRAFGTDASVPSKQLEDPGIFGNQWSQEEKCSRKRLIVGLRTRVEWSGSPGSEDDTALNDVEFYCYQPSN